jgi:hypothetical protein
MQRKYQKIFLFIKKKKILNGSVTATNRSVNRPPTEPKANLNSNSNSSSYPTVTDEADR